MRDATLCFLVKESGSKITGICLAMKKRGFGEGLWNGAGGKVEADKGEAILAAAKRETYEELRTKVTDLSKVAELDFEFPERHEWSQRVHVFITSDWIGEPMETEEMRPRWFAVSEIPYEKMWADDPFWLPLVLERKLVKAYFSFDSNNKILGQDIKEVASLKS